MTPIPSHQLWLITGGAAKLNGRVNAGKDELKAGVQTVADAVKDIAASKNNDSSSSMLPMMMMMMKNKQH